MVELSSNYEHVKEVILQAYELVPEAYRQTFRNYFYYDSKTHVEFARKKENLFNRWCHSKEVGQDFEKLKQMVLLGVKRYYGSGNRESITRNMDNRKRQGKSTENVGLVNKVEPLKPISCRHCGKPRHIITNTL